MGASNHFGLWYFIQMRITVYHDHRKIQKVDSIMLSHLVAKQTLHSLYCTTTDDLLSNIALNKHPCLVRNLFKPCLQTRIAHLQKMNAYQKEIAFIPILFNIQKKLLPSSRSSVSQPLLTNSS